MLIVSGVSLFVLTSCRHGAKSGKSSASSTPQQIEQAKQQEEEGRILAIIKTGAKQALKTNQLNLRSLARFEYKSGDPFSQTTGCIGYKKQDVLDRLKAVKEQLLNSLEDESLAAMHAYVKQHFPTPESLETCENKSFTEVASLDAGSNAFEKVDSFLRKLSKTKKSSVTFRVISNPSEARFELSVDQEVIRSTRTDSDIYVQRGQYTYSVEKNGYKCIREPLNLVDQPVQLLDCTLYKQSDPDGPYPCKVIVAH